MKKLFVFIALTTFTLGLNAQDITGNWQMYKNVDKPAADSGAEFGVSKTAEEIGANKWLSFKNGKMTMKLQIQGGEIGEDSYDYDLEDSKIIMKRGDRSKEYGKVISVTKDELVIFTEMDGWDHYKRID